MINVQNNKLNSKLIRTYYNPMINKFSIKSIQDNKISIEEFIEWYKTFKKAYTSSVNIIKVLEYLNSPLVNNFKLFIENDGKHEDLLYKECVSLGYKDTIKTMKTDIQKLNNVSKLSLNSSLDFCLNTIDKFILVNNRIIILEVLKSPYIIELQKIQIDRNTKIVLLREIAHDTNIRMKYIKEIDLHFGDISNIKKIKNDELLSYIKKYRYKRIIMKVVEYLLKNTKKLIDIQNNLSHEYSVYNKVDFFFNSRPSTTLKDIFTQIMEKHELRLKKSSSYVEDRLKDFELRIVNFLEHMDSYSVTTEKREDPDNIIIFLNNCKEDEIYNMLFDYGKQSIHDNSKVKSKVGKHHQSRQRLVSAITFLKNLGKVCVCYNYIKTLKTSIFLSQIENKSELLDWDKRRVYTDEEVSSMLEESKESVKDVLMITILREIGLRNSAICNLKIKDLVDEFKHPKHICRVKEKGNKIREFVTSNNIKKLVVTYLHEYNDILEGDFTEKYVFSRNKELHIKMCGATLNNVLKRIAIRAGVTNVNVQAHTFRHTLVGKLMDAGNNIETVSKFIGHSSVDTTMTYYWLKNISDLANEINNPFTRTILSKEEIKAEKDSEIEMLNKQIDTCFQIIGIYKDEIQKASSVENLKDTMDKHNVNINKILKYIADSVSGDTLSIYSSHIDVKDFI